ncbi:hypothetical protein KIPB_008017 [Kipferlia bialata]|uniref:Uncharacterized protein n=1 Tax=Kipferlia bialata TaxID=797122 RepID=A0A9K3D2R1_9EUKA|nr:hypothetical protein KIPB_008017 [Kipferlia bialata]|eukprot:g8017.t1
MRLTPSVPISIQYHPCLPGCILACTYEGDLYSLNTTSGAWTHLYKAEHSVVKLITTSLLDHFCALRVGLLSDCSIQSFLSVSLSSPSELTRPVTLITQAEPDPDSEDNGVVAAFDPGDNNMVVMFLGGEMGLIDLFSDEVVTTYHLAPSMAEVTGISFLPHSSSEDFVTHHTGGHLTRWALDYAVRKQSTHVSGSSIQHIAALPSHIACCGTAGERDHCLSQPVTAGYSLFVSRADGTLGVYCSVQQKTVSHIPSVIAKYTYPNGDVYLGEQVGGVRCGNGSITLKSGKTMYGSWRSNTLIHGTVMYPSAAIYVGCIQNLTCHGPGSTTYPNGNVFCGVWSDAGKADGTMMYSAHGRVYVGSVTEVNSILTPHGKGSMSWVIFDTKYIGEWKGGKMNGTGEQVDASGLVYKGEWKDDEYHGKGTRRYIDGGVYVGEWKDGKQHGHGHLTYPNGDVYEGGWAYNKRHGHGTHTEVNGTVYVGERKDDLKHGQGTQTIPSEGIEYTGEWKDDRPHGHGQMTTIINSINEVYVGEWKEGCRCGRGQSTVTDASGMACVYDGDWVASKRSGFGTSTWSYGGKYTGTWRDDMFHGYGTEIQSKGSVYTGCYRDGQWHGLGLLKRYDGQVLEGEFLGTKMSGYGRVSAPSGLAYEGELRNGMFCGFGKLTYPNGVVKSGHWEQHTLIYRDNTPPPSPVDPDDTLATIVTDHLKSAYCDAPTAKETKYPPVSFKALHTRVLYMPDIGKDALSQFCDTLRSLSLSVLDLGTVRHLSTLKRELAKDPQVVVCTHAVVKARPGSKMHKLHLGLWHDLVKRGFSPRVYMCFDEDWVYRFEQAARSLYTRLANTLRTHYVDKLSQEAQSALWKRGDTLQCIPLNRYFQEVWGDI